MINDYKDLQVWQRGRVLVKRIYTLTSSFPRDELYALTNQMRRAAISIPSNIAEGHLRNSTKDYIYFISIAIGSIAELETQVILAEDLEYTSGNSNLLEDTNVLRKMLSSLRKKLRDKKLRDRV